MKGNIAACAERAAIMEVSAEKPGNVTPTKSFSDLSYTDFVTAARRLRGFVSRAAEGENICRLIYEAVPGGKNINFGILMMFMPLAASHGMDTSPVLSSLTPDDTKWFVRAVQKAGLGGMELKEKSLERYDILSPRIFSVIDEEDITPLRLMEISQPYDTLASEWLTDYRISRASSYRITPDTIVEEYLRVLSEHPDTLIARKYGMEEAERVSKMARRVLRGDPLEEFDLYLRSRDENPGTTADIIATSLFLYLLRQ